MRARRYTFVIADRHTGAVRRLTISLWPTLAAVITAGALAVLTGISLWKPIQLKWLTALFGGSFGGFITAFLRLYRAYFFCPLCTLDFIRPDAHIAGFRTGFMPMSLQRNPPNGWRRM